uniref:Uncharacterized protein n=1 Tax=Lepeophtheirus salmonis TaxID=72036 RepID=A0A0K2UPQ8_LEPSM
MKPRSQLHLFQMYILQVELNSNIANQEMMRTSAAFILKWGSFKFGYKIHYIGATLVVDACNNYAFALLHKFRPKSGCCCNLIYNLYNTL